MRVGIVGATGYTALELLRLLINHSEIEVHFVTARKEVGRCFSDVFPSFRGVFDQNFVALEDAPMLDCDVVFFTTPHGVCMQYAQYLLENGVKVIDFSADFRLKNADIFEKWYGINHMAPDLLKEAVYGLPELNREMVKSARLLANPGCYPTAVQLGFAPLLKMGLVDTRFLLADVKSGVSGAGRAAKLNNAFAEMGESFQAYALSGHRHHPEIVERLSLLTNKALSLTFLPHLLPMVRGIEASLYAPFKGDFIDLVALYREFYQNDYFVEVLDEGCAPMTRDVRGSNRVQMCPFYSLDKNMVIVSVVEDNLVKGAAGQAVQCMNLMLGFPEQQGLTQVAMVP